jgi:hypothetical protein
MGFAVIGEHRIFKGNRRSAEGSFVDRNFGVSVRSFKINIVVIEFRRDRIRAGVYLIVVFVFCADSLGNFASYVNSVRLTVVIKLSTREDYSRKIEIIGNFRGLL